MRHGCQGCQGGSPLSFDLTMAFHPILNLGQGAIWGYEALVRGTEGQGAGQILALVNKSNRYKFDQACRVKAIELASTLFPNTETRLSINFLPNAVYEPAACIRATLEAARRVGFNNRQIMFEFTEDERIQDVAHVQKIVAEYRNQGFATALDDFGAGYAGLSLLASFQPDYIKIDMELIRGISNSSQRQTIVAGLVIIAERLNVTVIAEGVETEAELSALRSLGIDMFQGYLFAKPTVARLPDVWLPPNTPPISDPVQGAAFVVPPSRAA